MPGIRAIEAYLNSCTVSAPSGGVSGTGLIAIYKRIFSNRGKASKEEMVRALTEFYADKQNIIDIWKDLSECERDIISYIVRSNGIEFVPALAEFAKKYMIDTSYQSRWGDKKDILNSYAYYLIYLHLLKKYNHDTKTVLFCPSGKDMPDFILEVLKTLAEPMKIRYGEYNPSKYDKIICRERRIGDFAAVVRFAGSEDLKVKEGTFDLSKAKLIKLAEAIGFEEVCGKDGFFCAPKETNRTNDFKVALPLFVLAANSGLVEIGDKGVVMPGKKASELLLMPYYKLAKKLFDDYVKENSIYELHYITYITAYDGEWWIKWHECRKPIINLLKAFPAEKYIKFEDFNSNAKMLCGNFFRRLLNCSIMLKGYRTDYGTRNMSYTPDWDECEAQIIRLILSFLSAIGIVDIAYRERVRSIKYAGGDFCVGVAGFRITKLGAWILGITKKYEAFQTDNAQVDDGGLFVLPDYTVMISGLRYRIEYESYLSKFLTKVSTDDNASVYKLDFQSAVRAFDIGIQPLQMKEYLKQACSVKFPENVERSLDDWQAKIGRIRVSSVTILETDDPLLLEEIKHIKGMDQIIIRELSNAAAIDENQLKKAKMLIEKNGWIVKI